MRCGRCGQASGILGFMAGSGRFALRRRRRSGYMWGKERGDPQHVGGSAEGDGRPVRRFAGVRRSRPAAGCGRGRTAGGDRRPHRRPRHHHALRDRAQRARALPCLSAGRAVPRGDRPSRGRLAPAGKCRERARRHHRPALRVVQAGHVARGTRPVRTRCGRQVVRPAADRRCRKSHRPRPQADHAVRLSCGRARRSRPGAGRRDARGSAATQAPPRRPAAGRHRSRSRRHRPGNHRGRAGV